MGGKSGCLTDEADVSCTPKVNTVDNTIIACCIRLHFSMSVLLTMYRRSMYLIVFSSPVFKGRGFEFREEQKEEERILQIFKEC